MMLLLFRPYVTTIARLQLQSRSPIYWKEQHHKLNYESKTEKTFSQYDPVSKKTLLKLRLTCL